eukprot:3238611-Rhodomonas_salina.1
MWVSCTAFFVCGTRRMRCMMAAQLWGAAQEKERKLQDGKLLYQLLLNLYRSTVMVIPYSLDLPTVGVSTYLSAAPLPSFSPFIHPDDGQSQSMSKLFLRICCKCSRRSYSSSCSTRVVYTDLAG